MNAVLAAVKGGRVVAVETGRFGGSGDLHDEQEAEAADSEKNDYEMHDPT
jgi:hypothetical protein